MEKVKLPQRFTGCSIKLKNIVKKVKKAPFNKLLPGAYFTLIFFGILLTLAYSFLHSLVICSKIFGTDFCTPTGIFIALIISLPGYLISGNLMAFAGELPWGLSLAVVIGTSIAFYYLLGLFIDNFKAKKMDSENIAKYIIIAFFAILLILVIGLL